ncbi:EAL domain-containing protein [Lyngbya confervoides BDU141951]|uniref:EAL domain-containing protein n=2 Tax=Lyngbya TaxID=28073 RepID=A0ABD4T133_9CYAN|nr:EAL domain-containing protein [Lyngbya confervoides BDU141951]
MHPGSVAAFQLEANLRQALETHAFTLYFQPVFDLSSEGLVGFEALLRWHHPNHGLLLPQDFLEIAQECGLILPMGWQVLEQACAQLQTWQQRYQPRPPLSMGINLNPQQLLSPDLVPRLRHVLDQYAIEPLQLKLELSGVLESMSVEDLHRRLQRLKELGVTICLDRVSGLDLSTTDNEMLAAVVDEVKLDPALILCMESEASLEKVRTLVVAARRLNCQVGCAGIEDGPKLAQLRAFKCDQGQGWFFAKPCSAAEIETHWESHNIHRDEFSSSLNAPAIILNSETQQSQLSLFGRQSWTIGRSTDSAIVLPDRWVSRYHAELQCMSNGDVYFVDLGSGNGSFVNEQRVTMPVLLKGGDRLMVGQTHLEFFMPSNVSAIDETPSGGLPSPKTVLMMQSSKLQGEVWREALTSQGLSLIWLQPNVDLVQLLEQRTKTHQPLPDLLLLDMTVIKPNPYSFCRWCGQEYQDLQIILTSGSRTHVPASERQWAINQGAKDLLSAFPEHNIFGNMVDVVTKVRIVLSTLGMEPSEQTSLSEVLMSIRTSINRATLH